MNKAPDGKARETGQPANSSIPSTRRPADHTGSMNAIPIPAYSGENPEENSSDNIDEADILLPIDKQAAIATSKSTQPYQRGRASITGWRVELGKCM